MKLITGNEIGPWQPGSRSAEVESEREIKGDLITDCGFRYNSRRRQRGARAVEIYGLWMNLEELKKNIIDFGDEDRVFEAACRRGLRCYAANREVM